MINWCDDNSDQDANELFEKNLPNIGNTRKEKCATWVHR